LTSEIRFTLAGATFQPRNAIAERVLPEAGHCALMSLDSPGKALVVVAVEGGQYSIAGGIEQCQRKSKYPKHVRYGFLGLAAGNRRRTAHLMTVLNNAKRNE
jgi:hypothetical protein